MLRALSVNRKEKLRSCLEQKTVRCLWEFPQVKPSSDILHKETLELILNFENVPLAKNVVVDHLAPSRPKIPVANKTKQTKNKRKENIPPPIYLQNTCIVYKMFMENEPLPSKQ